MPLDTDASKSSKNPQHQSKQQAQSLQSAKKPKLCTTKPFLGSIAIFSLDATDSIIL